jgi:hypothetical protein
VHRFTQAGVLVVVTAPELEGRRRVRRQRHRKEEDHRRAHHGNSVVGKNNKRC